MDLTDTHLTNTRLTDLVPAMLHAVDTLDWDTVRRCFAADIATDYTSLWGGEPEKVAGDDLVDSWASLLTGFDATLHLTGPIVVTRADDHAATGVTAVRGYHHLVADDGQADTWMVAGHYELGFTRAEDGLGWKIDALTLTVAYEDGDRVLVDAARARGEAHAGGRFPSS